MECFVCLDPIKQIPDCVKRESMAWNDLDVQAIVEKHLWSLSLFQTETLWLCLTCWDILKEFHKFYTRIQTTHFNLEKIIKQENVNASSKDLIERPISTDSNFSENLDEQEIEFVQENSKRQKYENLDKGDDKSNDDSENNVPLIELTNKRLRKSLEDDDLKKNKVFLADPLEKIKEIDKSKKSIVDSQAEEDCKEVGFDIGVNEDSDSINKEDVQDEEDEMPLMQRLEVCRKRKNLKIQKKAHKLNKTIIRKKKIKSKLTKEKDFSFEESLEKKKHLNPIENLSTDHLNELLQIKNNQCIIKHSTPTTIPTTSFFYQSSISCSQYNFFIAEHCIIECHECQQMKFLSYPEFQEHFRENHKGRPYLMCCNTKFYDRSLLVDHINLHKNAEYFKCKHCSKILTSRRNFNIHMRCHDKPLSCDVCGKKFERKCFLNYHRQTHMSAEEKTIPCPDCGKFFASQYLLKNHRRVIHLRKYAKLCNICGQSLLNLESFKRHMKLHEDKTPPLSLSCETCGLLVSSERYLKAHIKSKHPVGGNAEKICTICRKVLQNADSLRHHIRRNHNTGYIHKCKICERAFKRIDHLKAHMNIHTGSDKSKCPWCPRTFNANSSMHHHRKKAHPKEWEEARRKKYIGHNNTNTAETNEFKNSNSDLIFLSIEKKS